MPPNLVVAKTCNCRCQQSSGVTSLSWRVVVRYDDVLLETDQELTFSCYLRQPGASYDWHAWMLAHDNVYVFVVARANFLGGLNY